MLNNILLTETGTLWLGSESSYHATLAAYQKMAETDDAGYKKECFANDEEDSETTITLAALLIANFSKKAIYLL